MSAKPEDETVRCVLPDAEPALEAPVPEVRADAPMTLLHELVDARPEGRPRLSEEVLFEAHGMVEVPAPAPCGCGAWIAPATTGAIPATVRQHNATAEHTAWAQRAGLR